MKCALKNKYKTKTEGFKTVIEELEQCISTKALKFKCYNSRVKQYRQNSTFKNNQKALHETLDGKMRDGQVSWSELWDNSFHYDRNAEWQMTVEKELECVTQQGNVNIIKEDVSIRLRKMPNWKAPGPDVFHGFWLKKIYFSSRGNCETFR